MGGEMAFPGAKRDLEGITEAFWRSPETLTGEPDYMLGAGCKYPYLE